MLDKYSWITAYPEIVLMVMGCAIAMIDLGVRSAGRGLTYGLTMATLAVVAWMQCDLALAGNTYYGFGNMVVSDAMGNWLKFFSTIALMVTVVYGRPYASVRGMLRGGEFFTLAIFSLLGMFVMISGNNFLVIYLGLELLTLSSYALVALRRDCVVASEAAMKYFVLGSLASGFLLYGLSMLYGATGTLDINMVFEAVGAGQIRHQVLVFGLVFVVAGLAFKLGAVPFHMWMPDVYQGAPTAITLMIGAAPKLAAFAIVMRLLVEGLLPLAIDWQQMLGILAVASLFLGNLAAIAQTNLKRMLAFSTISQVGFILLGLMSGVVAGNALPFGANAYSSAMFYVVTYVLTTLACFGVMMLLSREGFESEEIIDFSGLNTRSPLYAAVMAVALLSLAGIPPMVGFYAKLAVLQALIASGDVWHLGLAVYAVVMSLIGAFYYLRVIKLMYFDPPITASSVVASAEVKIVLGLNGLLILLFGIMPGSLMALCGSAIRQMLGT